jgi:hypothetical protein
VEEDEGSRGSVCRVNLDAVDEDVNDDEIDDNNDRCGGDHDENIG